MPAIFPIISVKFSFTPIIGYRSHNCFPAPDVGPTFPRDFVSEHISHGRLNLVQLVGRVAVYGELDVVVLAGYALHDDVLEVSIGDGFSHPLEFGSVACSLEKNESGSVPGSMATPSSLDRKVRITSSD